MVSRQKLAANGSAFLATFFVGASAISTCLTVDVTGAEGDLSGTYTYDGSDSYIRRGGSTSYVLGKYTSDEWRLGEGLYLFDALDNYPNYYTFDSAGHPVDIVEAWQLVATAENEEEAPSSFSITCPVDPTPSPIVDPTPSPTLNPPPSPPSSSTLPGPTPGNANTPAPGNDGTSFTQPTSSPGVRGATPTPAGLTAPSVSGETTCTTDVSCPDDKCCHPETNTCGRTTGFCQERSGKKMCCQNSLQDASTTESCFEDEVCEAEGSPWWDTAWWALASAFLIPVCLPWCKRRACGRGE